MKAFVLQMTSSPDVAKNIATVRQQLFQHQQEVAGAVVVLPECFALFGGKDKDNLGIAEQIGSGPIQAQLARLAQEFGIYLVAGSIPTKGQNPDKFYSTCFVYSPTGERIADYQKIHLFDVIVDDPTGCYAESNTTEPGNEVVSFDTQWGKVGVAICYDLRFPGLFQQLRDLGVVAVVLPSAFTQRTGAAHWQALLQARAIENQVFMIAANQNGRHSNGRETYGHSLIVSPWGNILCNAETANVMVGAELNLDELLQVREKIPVSKHNRFTSTYNEKNRNN